MMMMMMKVIAIVIVLGIKWMNPFYSIRYCQAIAVHFS